VTVVPEGQLVYGMQLPIQSQSKTFAEDWEHNADVDELVSIARHADRTGFFYVAVCDHVGVPAGPHADHMGTTWYDTVATLSMLAGVTENVRLMSSVYVVAYRHPLQTAKAWMTLDRLSGGRARRFTPIRLTEERPLRARRSSGPGAPRRIASGAGSARG